MNLDELVCITVTFFPDPEILKRQLELLPRESCKLVVDNSADVRTQAVLADLCASVENAYVVFLANNVGLGEGINQGVVWAKENLSSSVRYLLLLDQDSEPQPGSVSLLLSEFRRLENGNVPVGSVGPSLKDAHTGLFHGFHQPGQIFWHRVFPGNDQVACVPCVNLNGSGTLTTLRIFEEAGGLEGDFFIDHIDTEWAFRLLSKGYGLFGIPRAVFLHRMGENSIRFWCLGWRVWPTRSPLRHYYLFRNAVSLMRRGYVPFIWKFWGIVKLMLTAFVHGFFDKKRRDQLRHMMRGVIDGMR
jgi:rhamnosyltransferase